MASTGTDLGATAASGGNGEGLGGMGAESAAMSAVETAHPTLPRFMTTSATTDVTDEDVDADALEDSVFPGDTGDSDDESPEVEDTAAPVAEWHATVEDETHVEVVENEEDAVLLSLNVASSPPGWTPKPRQVNKGEPAFGDVDNPGGWSEFIFRPAWNASKKYARHCLPTGATPVPANAEGKRISNGWEFHYTGWKKLDDVSTTETLREKEFRQGATSDDLFKDRDGCLDGNVLKKLGLTKERMVEADALFFYQLLLPVCDPKQSGIDGDPRKAFYTNSL